MSTAPIGDHDWNNWKESDAGIISLSSSRYRGGENIGEELGDQGRGS
jgi:hypothetical protein